MSEGAESGFRRHSTLAAVWFNIPLKMNPQLLQNFGGLAGLGRGGGVPQDGPVVDTAETVHISSLALLKMLKHGSFSL